MAKAKKAVLVCRPCGAAVTVTDLGAAVVECWECGLELEPAKIVSAKTLVAVPKAAARRSRREEAARRSRPRRRPPRRKRSSAPADRTPRRSRSPGGRGFSSAAAGPPRKDCDEHGRTVPPQVDRLGSHPALQPALHPLPLLRGDDLRAGRLHDRARPSGCSTRSPSSPSRSSCSPAASRCCAPTSSTSRAAARSWACACAWRPTARSSTTRSARR